LSCYECNRYYHASCAKLSNDVLSGLLSSGAIWSCSKCKSKTKKRKSIIIQLDNSTDQPKQVTQPKPRSSLLNQSGSSSNQRESPNASDDHVAEIAKITSDVTSMKSSLVSFQESMDFFSSKFDDFKSQLDLLESVLARVTELENTNASLQQKVEILTEKVNKHEQDSFSNDLVLCGIPETERDDITTDIVVCDFLRTIGVMDITPNDIKFARRINPRSNPGSSNNSNSPRYKPPKILARFYSEQARDYVKFKIRSKKKSSPTISFADKRVNYYAADFLSSFNNHLFNNAKDFAKQHKYFKVWISNGSILLKKTSNSQPIIVRSVSDILNIND
jgi:hypothetical protein